MNMREILEALFNGEKLTHVNWPKEHFIELKGHQFFDEKGREISYIYKLLDDSVNKHEGFSILKPTLKYAPYMYQLDGLSAPTITVCAYENDEHFKKKVVGGNMIWFKRMIALEVEV